MSYFTINEFTKSSTAKKLRISNKPDAIVISHIEELIVVLDGLRRSWGSAIIINSGYRCPELNKAVGGSITSSHLTGYAVDMKPKNGKMLEFYNHVVNYFKDKPFDQIINEKPINGVPSWVHLGLKNSKGLQRKQLITIK